MAWLVDESCVCGNDLNACHQLGLNITECSSQTHNCNSDIICDGTRQSECQTILVTRDVWHVIIYEPIAKYTPTKVPWDNSFGKIYSIPAVRAKLDLTKVVQPIFSIVASEITGRLKLELGSLEFYAMRASNASMLEVAIQSAYLYRHRVRIDASIPMDRLYSFADIPELNETAFFITTTINQRFFQAFNASNAESWLKINSEFRLDYRILNWDEYLALLRHNILLADQATLPEMLRYFVECEECYFMPSIKMDLEKESVTPPQTSMMNSLRGTMIDVDLCMAKSKKLFFSVNANGEPPFQESFLQQKN